MTKIKICGIQSFDDISYVNQAQPDYIGFVFAKSKRKISMNFALQLKSKLSKTIQAVGVFVNEEIPIIKALCDSHTIDIIQLHGDEPQDYINALKKQVDCPIIKAIRVQNDVFKEYAVEYMLFDTFHKNAYGGTGESFDWTLIKGYQKPFFLAGGLDIHNITKAIKMAEPYCVDLSSGVETNNIKDKQKILDIVTLVRSVE